MKISKVGVRTAVLAVLVLIVFVLFGVRLMQLQIVEGKDYLALAEKGDIKTQTIMAARGEIVDRNMEPLAKNRVGYDIVLDKVFMTKDMENQVILRLVDILKANNEPWIDNLPITMEEPFQFMEGREDDVAKLKETLGLQNWATLENVMDAMVEEYKIEGLDPVQTRIIAGVRYEMVDKGYSIENPYTFASDVSMDTVAKVKENNLDLPGADVYETPIREYVNGTVAPHIVGQIGPIYKEEYAELKDKGYLLNDTVGKSGIEQYFESYLRGENGTRDITLNNKGIVSNVETTKAPKAGNTVVLTIDSELQKVAAKALEDEIKLLNATAKEGEGKEANAGVVVAVDTRTGEILAAVNYPSFDLSTYRQNYNTLSQDPLRPLFNRAFEGTYTPGSIFKPCVATAALTEGIITPESTVQCSGTYLYYAPSYTPGCLGVHGQTTVFKALMRSCNIFFYDVGRRTGIENIAKYAKALGLGVPTGVEIGEAKGVVASREYRENVMGEQWHPGDVIQASIGQSDNKFSPLQLANYVCTIANKGKRKNLHIVKEIRSYNQDQVVETFSNEVVETVSTPAVFDTVIEGMRLAASPQGTSVHVFDNYPYTVAAKTGTPETKEFPNSTYICFAPVEDPQIAIVVVIEKGWHGYTGAPVAKKVFDQYFFGSTQTGESGDSSSASSAASQASGTATTPTSSTDSSASSPE
ncbi:penicillin-binding transpeptidase domain-containing protein [Zongyangia hominis]|uniref:Penicillin-binding protein n=1 Tax=Zongyangia hominis TaxID=2763677 RepID=A0A926EGP0_9FIRM|nr:penicillin-binding transpeptidase domain-containing protein [Zongyangia hominis]MBC8571347.1 penicillin-binding protein [Zongyangia hominis]